MKYKYVIGSGCSFGRESWTKEIGKGYECEHITLSNAGGGNTLIIFRTIRKIQELIKKGVNPKSILLVNMLTDWNRKDILIDKYYTIEYDYIVDESYNHGGPDRLVFINDDGDIDERNSREELKEKPYPNRAFLKTGGIHWNTGDDNYLEFIREWYKKYYSIDGMFTNTLKEVVLLQNFCNTIGVDCFFTVWQNIFHYREKNELTQCTLDKVYFKSRNKKLMKDVYSSSKTFWDMIDFDKFIFYENEEIEMGGNAEFSIYNDIPLGWGDGVDTTHPNDESNKLFGKYLKDKIKEYHNEV
tara:strand:+ start:147 stop:1043 length:897 start_codon:yes stop_codon:yes gene_type:complete